MITITDNDDSRCRAALEFLSEGKGIVIGSYFVRLLETGVIEVGVPTQWDITNQSKEQQSQEIEEAKRFFSDHVAVLPHLGPALSGREYSFQMIFDWGKGAVALNEPTEANKI